MSPKQSYGLGALGTGVLALVVIVINYIDPTRAFLDEARASGGAPKMIADLILNPAFQVILVVVAIVLGVQSLRGGKATSEITDASARVKEGFTESRELPVPSLLIHAAKYGIGEAQGQFVDVAESLRDEIRDVELAFPVQDETLRVDKPFRGRRKKLWVTYSITQKIEVEEDDELLLPPRRMRRTLQVDPPSYVANGEWQSSEPEPPFAKLPKGTDGRIIVDVTDRPEAQRGDIYDPKTGIFTRPPAPETSETKQLRSLLQEREEQLDLALRRNVLHSQLAQSDHANLGKLLHRISVERRDKGLTAPDPYVVFKFWFINASVFSLKLVGVEGATNWGGHPLSGSLAAVDHKLREAAPMLPHGESMVVHLRQFVRPEVAQRLLSSEGVGVLSLSKVQLVFAYEHDGSTRELRQSGPGELL